MQHVLLLAPQAQGARALFCCDADLTEATAVAETEQADSFWEAVRVLRFMQRAGLAASPGRRAVCCEALQLLHARLASLCFAVKACPCIRTLCQALSCILDG